MFHLEIDFNTGESKDKQFKSLQGACQWLMNQRGVESVMLEKLVAAPSLDLEDEIENLLGA